MTASVLRGSHLQSDVESIIIFFFLFFFLLDADDSGEESWLV